MKNNISKIKLVVKYQKIIAIFLIIFSVMGLFKIFSFVTEHSKAKADNCQKYNFSGPPPSPTNLVADYVYSYDNTMVKVIIKWSSPDLIGYLVGENDCLNALDGWDTDTSKLPLSDFKYLITGDDGTNVVIENNYFGVNFFNSGGYFKQTFNASDKPITKKYSVYAFRTSDGTAPIISVPSDITVTINPLESAGCTASTDSNSSSNNSTNKNLSSKKCSDNNL